MIVLTTLLLIWTVILNTIELSSQSEGTRNGARIPDFPRAGTSYSSDRIHSPQRSRSRSPSGDFDPAGFHYAGLPPAEYDPAWFPPSELDFAGLEYGGFHPVEFPPTSPSSLGRYFSSKPPPPDWSSSSKPSSPARSFPSKSPPPARTSPSTPRLPSKRMDPPNRLPSSNGHGFGMEYIKFIRLTTRKNPPRTFELRKYTFADNKSIKLRIGDHFNEPVPTQEQIVMSTSDGEVFAILKSTNALAGMYMYDKSKRDMRRVKINMESGAVTLLTKEEINETPVGNHRPITKAFRIKRENEK